MIRSFENGDIVTSGMQFRRGSAATAQGIYHRLRLFTGEYFLDVGDGTPWFQNILGKAPQDIAEVALKQRILSAPGVVALTEFRLGSDRTQRRLAVQASVLDVNNAAVQVALDEEII